MCSKYVRQNHICYVEKADYPKYKQAMKYIFYDFECTQDTGIHIPNLVVAKWSCSDCLDNEAKLSKIKDQDEDELKQMYVSKINNCSLCAADPKKRDIMFEGDKCTSAFCAWLFSEPNHGCTFLGHNAANYDSYFILKYLVDNGIAPINVIRTGGKIRQFVEPNTNCRMIDSLSFLPMALAKLPKAFGFTGMKKGYFPFFNKK